MYQIFIFRSAWKHTLVAGMLLLATGIFAQPRNVIVYIGDGFGVAPKTATRMALGQGQNTSRFSDDPHFRLMEVDNLRYNTMVTTHSMNSWITDSAPGATVYAAGRKGKGNNEAVAFNMQANVPVETILEYAKKQGYAVGLVTTTRITHATPADFASHTWNRDIENGIAAQYISSTQAEYAGVYGAQYDAANKHWVLPDPKVGVELDVLLGGGSRHFLPKNTASANKNVVDAAGQPVLDANGNPVKMAGNRTDEIDLIDIAKTRGFRYVNSRDALLKLDLNQFTAGNNAKLLGLFHASHMDYEQDRQLSTPWEPSLADMTQIAIEVLKRKGGSKGFFLMVEGGRIDHLEHANAGGITYAPGSTTMQVTADKQTFTPEDVYVNPNSPIIPNIYGSDYLIKEVLAFDYAVGKGRDLLDDPSAQTLIFSTSDHECGGLAIVGLHDEQDAQKNGTKIRTYAKTPVQTAANGGGNNINPVGVTPGEAWYPDYVRYNFQGYDYPKPAQPDGRRIVIAYGSNPVVNGNGTALGATPGNHTPQDIWVGADDNVGGEYAKRITGRGLLDNTDLTPIMRDFLRLDGFNVWEPSIDLAGVSLTTTYCPFRNVKIKFTVTNQGQSAASNVQVKIPVPANASFISATATKGQFSHYCQNAVVCDTWTIPALAAGESVECTLVLFALDGPGPISATASVISGALKPAKATVSVPKGNCAGAGAPNTGSKGGATGFRAYPNPTSNELNLELENDADETASLKVFDQNGSIALDKQVALSKGANLLTIAKAELPAGQYFAVFSTGKWSSEVISVVKL